MGTGTVIGQSIGVLVQGAGARTSVTARGNYVLDILANTRYEHSGLYNLSWWAQDTLSCYTPAPHFYAANSLLDGGGDPKYPTPDVSASPYNKVHWSQVAGRNSVRVTLPDGEPCASHLKVMDDGPAGSTWALQTTNLGDWAGDFGSTGPGAFGLNRGLIVTVRRVNNDGAPANVADIGDPTQAGDIATENVGNPGDIRVNVGNLWSVRLPGDGGPATFEKKVARAKNGGLLWDRLHTFSESPANGVYYVALGIVAGRLFVNVVGRDIADTAYVYTEQAGKYDATLKDLTIPAAPVTVSGQSGGGGCLIGLRRIGYTYGLFTNTMTISDAVVSGAALSPPTEGELTSIRHTPIPNGDVYLTSQMLTATTLQYTAQITATSDGREPAACKFVMYESDRRAAPGAATTIDYGPAVRRYTLHLPEPDFNGTGGTRGSDASCDLEFDVYLLDQIAAAHGSDWKQDLAPYALASVVTSRTLQDAANNVTTESATRMVGAFEAYALNTEGFQQTALTLTLRDPMLLLKDPAGFIDTSYKPLDFLNPAGADYVFGHDAVRYILSKAISPDVGAALQVYMPPDWYPLSLLKVSALVDGKLPPNDEPLLNAPYGKFAAEWLYDVANYDFAALLWVGATPCYGQFDRIAASLPTHDLYTGQTATGDPTDLTRDQMAWSITRLGRRVRTNEDFTRWVVYAGALGGSGSDGTRLGVPTIHAEAEDFGRSQASWQRTKLFTQPLFVSNAHAEAFVRAVKDFSAGGAAAVEYTMTAPFGNPNLAWGHRVTLHGTGDVGTDGLTLRIYDLTETGDLDGQTVRTELKLTENLT